MGLCYDWIHNRLKSNWPWNIRDSRQYIYYSGRYEYSQYRISGLGDKMISEIHLCETHLKILNDVGYLYTKDEDEILVKLVYREW